MSRPLDVGINRIKGLLLKMGRLGLMSIREAVEGFQRMEDTYNKVRMTSNTIQILAEEVEDQATELITLHQPMASDLRILKAYIKIAYDLERYGRYAMDVGEVLHRIGPWGEIGESFSLEELTASTLKVMELSLEMLESMDETLIFELSKVESKTDELYFKCLGALSQSKGDHKAVIAHVLTARYLERLADHGSYIAESISYAVTGKRISIR